MTHKGHLLFLFIHVLLFRERNWENFRTKSSHGKLRKKALKEIPFHTFFSLVSTSQWIRIEKSEFCRSFSKIVASCVFFLTRKAFFGKTLTIFPWRDFNKVPVREKNFFACCRKHLGTVKMVDLFFLHFRKLTFIRKIGSAPAIRQSVFHTHWIRWKF